MTCSEVNACRAMAAHDDLLRSKCLPSQNSISVAHDKVVIDLQAKPDDFISLYKSAVADPKLSAKVPLLEANDGKAVIAESMVILDYLEDLSPASQFTAEQKARMRLFANLFPGRLSSFGILKAEPGSEEETAAVDKLREDLRAMDAFLAETTTDSAGGPFLFGSDFSYAEAAAAPFAQRLAIILPNLRPAVEGGRPALDPKAWMAEDSLTRLSDWMDAVCARPSCVDSLPPPDELCASYSAMVERMKGMAMAAK